MPIRAFEESCPNSAALLGLPLPGLVRGGFLGLGEEINLLGDDLTAIADLALAIGPARVVNAL